MRNKNVEAPCHSFSGCLADGRRDEKVRMRVAACFVERMKFQTTLTLILSQWERKNRNSFSSVFFVSSVVSEF